MSFTASIDGGNCACCGGGGSCYIECSTRGGVYTLCGFSEFLSTPSSPPKKYRKLTPSGKSHLCYHIDPDCSSPISIVDSYDFDGADVLQYDKETCQVNPGFYTHYGLNGSDLPCAFGRGGDAFQVTEGQGSIGPSFSSGLNSTISRTLTTWEETGLGSSGCISTPFGYYNYFGNSKQTLSIEDTDTDAIDRLLAGTGGIWTDFQVSSECLAQWSNRSSGFSGNYTEAKYRIKASGLVPFSDYTATVTLFRRIFESGPYEEFEERSTTISGDEFGFYTGPEETVANDIGYQTYVSACKISSVF